MTRIHISRRKLLASVSAGAATFAVPMLAKSQAGEPIRIGFLAPMTGPYGAEAQEQVRGAELAVKQFNDAGGANGRKAELLIRDDKLNPAEAATRTIELIERDKVHALVGGLGAAVLLSINNVAKQRKIVFNSIGVSDAINEAKDWSRYSFHEALTPHQIGGALARFCIPKLGKRAAFLTADYAWGHEQTRAIQRAGAPLGMEVLGDIRHPVGTTDYSTYFPRLQALKPEVLVVANFGQDQLSALKQITDFGLKQSMKVIVPQLVLTRRMVAGHGPYKDVIGGAAYYWALEGSEPSAKKFNAAFMAANGGRAPSEYGAYGYSGTASLLAGFKAAGSTDSDKLVDAMVALKLDLTRGPQYFRACDHQLMNPVVLMESKSKAEQAHEYDVFKILSIEKPSEAGLRSCSELGLTA